MAEARQLQGLEKTRCPFPRPTQGIQSLEKVHRQCFLITRVFRKKLDAGMAFRLLRLPLYLRTE
ncbi:hypothetical protein OAR36_05610, partial [Pseudomonadales bacterium]|nr:hypothetical protein [Pseudomonadales bacterium]